LAESQALIDTGAILAILNKRDPWHFSVRSALGQLRVPFITSEAVLTELFHLIKTKRIAAETAWGFVGSGGIALAPIEQRDLPGIHALMSRYADRPMDFADATLVHLARRESISNIFTIDHADFSTYRIEGKRRFRIFPEVRK
jgi:predicted nucleic acid-binding protein